MLEDIVFGVLAPTQSVHVQLGSDLGFVYVCVFVSARNHERLGQMLRGRHNLVKYNIDVAEQTIARVQ